MTSYDADDVNYGDDTGVYTLDDDDYDFIDHNLKHIVDYIKQNYPNQLNKECIITDIDINDPDYMNTFYETVRLVSDKIEKDIVMKKRLMNVTGNMLTTNNDRDKTTARDMLFTDGLTRPKNYDPEHLPSYPFSQPEGEYVTRDPNQLIEHNFGKKSSKKVKHTTKKAKLRKRKMSAKKMILIN
jgi:hypothetical protein